MMPGQLLSTEPWVLVTARPLLVNGIAISGNGVLTREII
jgi:hypothetical protein